MLQCLFEKQARLDQRLDQWNQFQPDIKTAGRYPPFANIRKVAVKQLQQKISPRAKMTADKIRVLFNVTVFQALCGGNCDKALDP